MISGYYKEIHQQYFDKKGVSTIKSVLTLRRPTQFVGENPEEIMRAIVKKHKLMTADAAMVITIKTFQFIDEFDSYENELREYYESDDPDKFDVNHPEDMCLLVMNDTASA